VPRKAYTPAQKAEATALARISGAEAAAAQLGMDVRTVAFVLSSSVKATGSTVQPITRALARPLGPASVRGMTPQAWRYSPCQTSYRLSHNGAT
jgi:hypothetical protein